MIFAFSWWSILFICLALFLAVVAGVVMVAILVGRFIWRTEKKVGSEVIDVAKAQQKKSGNTVGDDLAEVAAMSIGEMIFNFLFGWWL